MLAKQKMAIRKIHNLRYRDHTLPYFVRSSILQLPELVEHTTLCYVQSGIHQESPYNIKALWNIREQTRTDLRDRGIMLAYPVSQKEYVNTLPAGRSGLSTLKYQFSYDH